MGDDSTEGNVLFAKGAPESIVERCTSLMLPDGSVVPLGEEGRNAIRESLTGMAKDALRTLALAVRSDLRALNLHDYDGPQHASHEILTDPANVIMITGDNKLTAEAIAMKLGILSRNANMKTKSFTGKEFEALPQQEQSNVLKHIMEEKGTEGAVFSRTEPKHKQQIVKILKSLGEISAMTGDGVNDAPALKEAAIGIAMGIAGTEVAK